MAKRTYLVMRRFGAWAAGDEVQLSDDEAIRAENEAPGVLERIEQPEPKAKPIAAPIPKEDA